MSFAVLHASRRMLKNTWFWLLETSLQNHVFLPRILQLIFLIQNDVFNFQSKFNLTAVSRSVFKGLELVKINGIFILVILTGTTREVTPLARPVRTRPTYNIQWFWAAIMMVNPQMKGNAQNIRLNFRPILSTIHPPRRPPRAAPMVTTDYKTENHNIVTLTSASLLNFLYMDNLIVFWYFNVPQLRH